MRRKILTLVIVILIPTISQADDINSIWDFILCEFNIPEDLCFESIESAFSGNTESEITIEVSKHTNRHYENMIDFSYVLFFENYQITLYKSEASSNYFLTAVEIDLRKNNRIESLFPYQTINQFRLDEDFGFILENMSRSNLLAYEIDKYWNYILLEFTNDNITKIKLVFGFN